MLPACSGHPLTLQVMLMSVAAMEMPESFDSSWTRQTSRLVEVLQGCPAW